MLIFAFFGEARAGPFRARLHRLLNPVKAPQQILEYDCPDGISVIKPTVYLGKLDLHSAIIKDSWERKKEQKS